MNTLLKLLITVPLVFMHSHAHAVDNTGKDLLQYFSATCPSQGDWTQLVIADSEAIIKVLENLKNDPDCVSAAGSISQLNGLASKMTQLESNNQRKIEIEQLKAKEMELTNQLGSVSDAYTVGELQRAIREVQIEKAVLLAEDSSKQSLNGESISQSYSNIVLTTNQLYKSIANNSRCLEKNPQVISTVTSLVSSIGSGVAVVNPVLGLGLSAASELIGNTVEAVRIGRINRKIRKIADGTLVNSGFKCALESLSNRWCELSDARKLLEFKFSIVKKPKTETGFLSVMNIYDRKIPSFLEWLSKVRAGAPAATESDASRHEVVYERWKMVQVAGSKGDGTLTEFKKRYEDPATTSNSDRYNIIRQVVSKLTGMGCGGGSGGFSSSSSASNPLFDIYSNSLAAFRMIGLDRAPRENGYPLNFCDFDPFTQWPAEAGTYIPDYSKTEVEYKNWIRRATILVNKEFTQVLQPDSLGVLSSAFERTGSKWKISPKQSIDDIIAFLAHNRPANFETSAFKKIYLETQNNLQIISDTLTDSLVLQTTSPSEAIERIFNTAELQFGTVVFNSRLEMAVRISLDEYFAHASREEQNIAAQMMAMDSSLDTLRKISGKDTDELVMLDIQQAQKGALSNMRTFVDAFAKSLHRLIKKTNKKILSTRDTSQSSHDIEDLGKLCVHLASMPYISHKIDMTPCYGKKLKAMIKGGPETTLITEKYLQKQFSERNCEMRNYLRKSKIYREWDIKL